MRHKGLAVLIVIVLFFTISIALSSIQLKKITASDFLLKSFNQSGLYTNLPLLVSNAFSESNATDSVAYQVIAKAVEPTYLKQQVEINLPLLVDYLNGNKEKLEVNLDFRPFKNSLQNQPIEDLKKTIAEGLKSMPACTPSEEKNWLEVGCQPKDIDYDAQASSLADQFKTTAFLGKVPDYYTIDQSISDPDKFFEGAKRSFYYLNLSYYVSIILSILLIVALIMLSRNQWPSALRWTGLALILPGGVHLSIALISKANVNPIISACVEKASPAVANLLKPVITVFAGNIFNVSMFYSGVIFFAGLILIVISYIFGHNGESNVQSAGNSR